MAENDVEKEGGSNIKRFKNYKCTLNVDPVVA